MRGASCFFVALSLVLCNAAAFAGSSDRVTPFSAEQVRILAATYAHRYICVCATAEEPMWRGDYWEIPISTSSLGHSSGVVRIDRRTGEVSYPGEPSASVKEVEQWAAGRKKK